MSKLEQALYNAFYQAINEVGIDAFKKTSLFGSNEKKKD